MLTPFHHYPQYSTIYFLKKVTFIAVFNDGYQLLWILPAIFFNTPKIQNIVWIIV